MKPTTDFLWKVHGYTNEYIRFADTKAAAVVAWAGAMLSALVAKDAHNLFLDGKLFGGGAVFVAWVALFAFLTLGLGFVSAICVIKPRLYRGVGTPHANELIYWESVRSYDTATAYLEAVERGVDEERVVAEHLAVLADIAHRKYNCLFWSIALTAVGTLLGIVVLFGFV